MKKINFDKLLLNKETKIISMQEGLSEVIPFDWSNEVINNNKKVIIDYVGE